MQNLFGITAGAMISGLLKGTRLSFSKCPHTLSVTAIETNDIFQILEENV